MINRALSAAITVAFLAVVRPDPDVSLAGTAFVGILMYEGLRVSIEYIRKIHSDEQSKNRRKAYERWLHRDGYRWASEIIGRSAV